MAVYGVAFKFDSVVELVAWLDRIEADFGDIKIKDICKFKNSKTIQRRGYQWKH